MASRDDILRAVRGHRPPPADLPDPSGRGHTYDDRPRQFAAVLESVGGRCVFAADLAALNQALAGLPEYADAKAIVSLVPGAGAPNIDLDRVTDPHELASVDFALVPGRFGVAENGAVWVTDEGVRHRAIFFIVQHLALVIAAGDILDNMHQAYERLAFGGPGFGVFISGPSKTADIEQSLVIGAHGPRSLTVCCLGSAGLVAPSGTIRPNE
jgi:L-lactate dehydrogenase complex protein LldG